MYGIFAYIYHKNQPNVCKYTLHGWYGCIHLVVPMLGGCGRFLLPWQWQTWWVSAESWWVEYTGIVEYLCQPFVCLEWKPFWRTNNPPLTWNCQFGGGCFFPSLFSCGSLVKQPLFKVPEGDILIHCGDLTNRGSAPELQDVNAWLEEIFLFGRELRIVFVGVWDVSSDVLGSQVAVVSLQEGSCF